jgi:UDP-perosamine 4-acetyltransferase
MKEKIIVIGGGGHAKVIISIMKKLKTYEIIGFTELEKKSDILGQVYLGTDDILSELYDKGISKLVLGIGQIKSSAIRKKIVDNTKVIGFEFPSIISPNAVINEQVEIGCGTVIMDGVVINSGSKIGEFSIINTNSSIDHDCKIGNHTHIAPGVTLSGDVIIGDDVLIGTGANVIQGINILDKSIISAGSSVQSSTGKSGLYRGVPAKFIKDIK